MQANMRVHAAVGDEFLAAAERVSRISHRFPFPCPMLWSALASAHMWSRWLPIDEVRWTGPVEAGLGATRIARFGAHCAEESFFAWEEGERMAFRFDRSTLPVRALAEDYRLTPCEGGCELHWTGRIQAPFGLGLFLNWQLARGVRSGLHKLEAILHAG